MGYTHYWKFTMNPKDIENGSKKFKKAVTLFKKCIAKVPKELDGSTYDYTTFTEKKVKVPFALAGGMGTGEPVLEDNIIRFNGVDDGVNDYAHETCVIMLDDDDPSFNFCKTARKPYDVAVCLALLCFKKMFGNDFSYSSDGKEDEDEGWVMAHQIFDGIK